MSGTTRDGLVVRPSGTVTFLFTDIEGSSLLWSSHPSEMARALERHDEIMRASIEGNGGYVFTTAGDSFAAAFQRVDDALTAAIAGQRSLAAEVWPDPAVLRVRMGIHTGQAEERDGDYFGTAVNAAARVMSAGHGGQILVSDVVQSFIGDAQLLELGRADLRGLPPMRLWQVLGSGLESAFPPVKALVKRSHTLPRLGSTMVGRIAELQKIHQDLETHDLVTLTGVGGCGKTRLAIEAGRRWLESNDHAVWFVDLSALGDADGLGSAVCEALLIDRDAQPDPRAAALKAVAREPMLLIIDNCEHLPDAVAELVEDLLNVAEELSVLVTSREALAVEGEGTIRVPSLDANGDGEAVQLFIERARNRDPDFAVTDADHAGIARICEALDGLPLAIELAAGRADVMSVAEIEGQLNDRFAFLGGRRRRGRSRTLGATLDWSYELLDRDERQLLEDLSDVEAVSPPPFGANEELEAQCCIAPR